MEEKGRRARARQRRRNLATNQTRFTHTGDDDLAVTVAEHSDGIAKVLIKTIH